MTPRTDQTQRGSRRDSISLHPKAVYLFLPSFSYQSFTLSLSIPLVPLLDQLDPSSLPMNINTTEATEPAKV